MIATSRAPLRITRERVYTVQPLPVPDLGADTTQGIEHVAAVRLYVERVHAADPHFAITDENAGAIARICRALDGLPLALELAAARVRTLGAEGTAARLGERLSLLSRGARDLPERQRSLRATLDWSVQLLDADAVRVFGALGAFSGGASLEAVEAVARGSDVPSALEDLLDAALVTRTAGATGEPRFGMLETVREYATELLTTSDEERGLRDRHLEWFLALVEGDGPYWKRDMNAAWLDQIELEHDNYRAALEHARATGDVERELRLANALRYFWRVRGYVVEGRRRLEAAVERSGSVDAGPPGAHARRGGNHGVHRRRLRALARPLDRGAAPHRGSRGSPRDRPRELRARRLGPRARATLPRHSGATSRPARRCRTSTTPWGTRPCSATSRSSTRRPGSPPALARHPRRRSSCTRGAATSTGSRSRRSTWRSSSSGTTIFPRQPADSARHSRGRERLGHREVMAYAVGYASELALALGRPDDAAVLCGAFDQMFELIDSVPQPDEIERHAQLLERLSTRIDVEEPMARGRALPADAVTSLVREQLDVARP